MNTLLLNPTTWDLVVDAYGNIAVASDPYSQAQDAASAIKTFAGEQIYDTTLGIPYKDRVLGQAVPMALLKKLFVDEALTVPGTDAAVCYIASFINRKISGQVQIVNSEGLRAAAGF